MQTRFKNAAFQISAVRLSFSPEASNLVERISFSFNRLIDVQSIEGSRQTD